MLLRALLIWGVLLLLEGIVVVLVVPPTIIVNAAHREELAMTTTLGDTATEKVAGRAKNTFQEWFIDTGVMAESFTLFVPSEAAKRQSTGMETLAEGVFDVVRKRLESAWNLVYVAIQRIYAFGIWLPLLLPFLVACVYDGATVRKVKLLTFGISSAPKYGLAVHTLIILAFFPLYYAAWPLEASPMVVPVWFVLVALLLRRMVENLQRM